MEEQGRDGPWTRHLRPGLMPPLCRKLAPDQPQEGWLPYTRQEFLAEHSTCATPLTTMLSPPAQPLPLHTCHQGEEVLALVYRAK